MNLFKLKYHDVSEADLKHVLSTSNNYSLVMSALKHKNITSDVLQHTFDNSKLHDVQYETIRHPLATEKMLHSALNNPNIHFQIAALKHGNTTVEMLNWQQYQI
jgi:hypothetical protein